MKIKMKKTLSLFLAAVLIVPMFASIPAKKAEAADEVMPESYMEYTFADLGFADGTYEQSATMYPASINANLEKGVVISGQVKFESNSSSRICFGAGIDNNGFKLLAGDNRLIFQNMLGDFFYYEFFEDIAGVPVVGKYVDLKLSLQKVELDGDSAKNDLKVGVWFKDKLYNNAYIYLYDYPFIAPFSPSVSIHRQPGQAPISIRSNPSSDEVTSEDLIEYTFADFGLLDNVYSEYASVATPNIHANIANGVVISGQVKFDKNTGARICFGDSADVNGFKLHTDYGENLVIQNMAPVGFFYYSFTEAVAGVPVTGEYVDLKLSFQKVNHDGTGGDNDLKLGVWFAGKLYNNQYIYMDNYVAINPLISNISIVPQGASVGIKAPLKGRDAKVASYEDISEYRKTEGNYTIPNDIPKGYLFAGWFEDESCETAIGIDKKNGAAYAKFVDEDLLGVKAQVTAGTTILSEETSMRILSAVDSLDYSKVGFELKVDDITQTVGNNTVYKTLTVNLGDGNTFAQTPVEIFGKAAEYFKACVITGIPKADFNTDIIVTPYWYTLDGTKVTGTPTTKKVSQGIGFIDDSHAYTFFGNDDKRSEWKVNSTTSYRELNTYKLNGSSLICDFVQEEKFSAEEYPYMAYRYKATTQKTQGLVYVATSEHTVYNDAGLTWIPLNTTGEWTNHIVNLSDNNAYWEGTVNSVRLDAVHWIYDDPNSTVYVDRIGFFKTQEEAEVFLNLPNEIDFSKSQKIESGFVQVMIPANAAAAGDSVSDFMLADVSAAKAQNGTMPLVGIKEGNTVTPVPVSYVNAVGYINYMAETKGEYVLYYPEKNPSNDNEFVSIRGIMTEAMIAADEVTMENVWMALRNTMVNKGNANVSQWASSIGIDTSNGNKAVTAKNIAKAIHAYMTYLDAEVFVDTNYVSASKLRDAEALAVGSGIITDINASTVSGKELASIIKRTVMAILDQPVGTSNIKKNAIKIGGWTHMTWKVDDAAMKQVADCGINMLMSVGDLENDNVLRQVLQSGRRYGIELLRYNYYPNNFTLSNPNLIPVTNYKYYDFDSYLGNHIFDEPGSDSFAMMGDLATYYQNQLPGKMSFYNLLPYYASAAQLKYGVNTTNKLNTDNFKAFYENYLRQYASTVPGNYMCMDLYPLRIADYGIFGKYKTTYDNYLKNMDIFATVCRETNRDFWLYIQSTPMGFGREVDYNDLRWQMYTGLSFGVNTFIHFTYGSYDNDEALIDKNGKPTERYYAAQKINKEIMALSDDYMQYKNVGAFNMNCTSSSYDYAQFDNQYEDFDVLKSVNSNAPLLFGCFEKKEGRGYAFSVVNMYDLSQNKSASLTFTLDGNHNVYAWIQGKKVSLTPNNGVYTLNLETAEGVFIVIE